MILKNVVKGFFMKETPKENYEKQREILLNKGYKENIEIISVLKAHVMALILTVPIIVVFAFLYRLRWNGLEFKFSTEIIIYILILILSIPIHELLHGLGWSIFCKEGFKSVRFGIMKPSFTPYCSCKEPLSFKGYLIGGILPLILLGLLPCVLGILIQSSGILFLGFFGVISAGGDMAIILNLLKYRDGIFLDHPSKGGFIVFIK